MSLREILEAIPALSFADRQQLIRGAVEADEELTPGEQALLDDRLKNFHPDSAQGVPARSLKSEVRQRLKPQ